MSAASPTTAISDDAVGRVNPAKRQSTPAVSQRSRSRAYRVQAASAVNKPSLYDIVWTMLCGSSPQSTASMIPTRRPWSRLPMANSPQAAASAAIQASASAVLRKSSGVSGSSAAVRPG